MSGCSGLTGKMTSMIRTSQGVAGPGRSAQAMPSICDGKNRSRRHSDCCGFVPWRPGETALGGGGSCQGDGRRGGAIQSDAAMLSIRESREAWHMAAAKLSDEAFSAILEAHPCLRERFASIAVAVANAGENLKEADAIEERILEEMRLLGREAMQGWAETQVKATEKEIRQQPSMHRQGKKNSAGIRNLAKSRV